MSETLKDLHTNRGNTEKPKHSAKRIIGAILLGVFLFLIISAGSAYAYFQYYQNKMYPGVKVAGYDVGGLSRKQSESVIGDKISKIKSVGLVMSSGDTTATYDVRLEDLGIGFDKEATLDKAYSVGRSSSSDFYNALTVMQLIFADSNVNLTMNYDDPKLQAKVNEIVGDQLIKKENAYFKVEDGELKIIGEKKGSEVNFLTLKEQIQEVLNSSNISQKIIVRTEEITPDITASDIEVNKAQIQKYIDKSLVIKDDINSFTPTKEQISLWIVLSKSNDKMKVDLSDDEMRKYIVGLSSTVDVASVDKKIDGNSGAVITEGNDGKIMNQEKAFLDTKSAMLAETPSAVITIQTQVILKKEVKTQSYAGNGTPGLAPGKYIEVNLSSQVLFAFDGTNQIGSYMVSTGAWDYPTPVGTRSIVDKSIRPFSAQYGLYMPFWNGLGGGYGIHELPEWPGGYKEGESHLGTPVSHGCIRLGVGPAEFIYGWAPIGTPVFIHY